MNAQKFDTPKQQYTIYTRPYIFAPTAIEN
jgi:hypothetical protein